MRSQKAFTLVELLVVMGIIAILVAVLFPTLSRAREKARQTKCIHNLHQIAIALRNYWNDYRAYPPPPNYSDGTGGLFALYEEGYITSKDILLCPDDPQAKNPPPRYSSYNWYYNYYGYDENGEPIRDEDKHDKYDLDDDGKLSLRERRQIPGLANPYAPDYIIVTHCPFHREFFGDKPEVQRDIILRLSGEVKTLPWTHVDWETQRE